MSESTIPEYFNELDSNDSEVILRSVVDFELQAKDGSLMTMEDLSHRGPATLVGFVVERLPEELKTSMLNLLTTTSQDIPDEKELAKLLPFANKRRKVNTVIIFLLK